MQNTTAMLLAGGQGSRLSILAGARAKPAVPFGSNYRIVDFTMSNVMHSGIRYLGVMTQYKPYSLMAHLGMGETWGFSGRRSVAKILPPYMGDRDSDWYAGTADAVYQNLSFVNRFQSDTILVLSGDHIYYMVYGDLISFHRQNDADLTICTQPVSWEEAKRYGVLKFDESGHIELFQEKDPDPVSNQANLGIYAFKRQVLEKYLREDAANPDSSHDFGNDIIPRMVKECRCFALPFENYWRDVGTLQSFWQANMDCLDSASGLNLRAWRVHTNWQDIPSSYSMPLHVYGAGNIVNSMIGKGSSIRGNIVNSIIFRGVEVGEGAEVRDSILMDGCRVGPGAKIRRVISDKHITVGANAEIGGDGDAPPNCHHPKHLSTGLTLIGKHCEIPEGARIGANCLLYPDLSAERFGEGVVEDGATLTPDNYGEE